MKKLKPWIQARLRRWLGIDTELERYSDAFTKAILALGEQQNVTAMNVHEAATRITFYEEHVESIRYARQRMLQQKGNGERRIQLLGRVT